MSGEGLHQCLFENCNRTFNKKWKLTEHICSHTGDRPFVCEEAGCDKSFVRRCHLQRHAASHSSDTPFSCATCTATFKFASNLRKHELTHSSAHPSTLYPCSRCEARFNKKSKLHAHLQVIHGLSNPYTCDECDGREFKSEATLEKHRLNVHLSQYMCSECKEIFDKFSVLQRHIAKVHKVREQCDGCGKWFTGRTGLRRHVSRCPGPQEQVAANSETVTEVVKAKHVRDDSTGPTVDNIYSDIKPASSLQDNIFASSDTDREEDKLSCKICRKVYGGKAQLTLHMRTVHGQSSKREFVCAECGGVFHHKPNLVRHIQSKHKGVKRFSCPDCPKQFFYKHAYERHHRAIHAKPPPTPTESRPAWNKTSELENISGHFVDDRVRHYVTERSHVMRSQHEQCGEAAARGGEGGVGDLRVVENRGITVKSE